MEYQFSEFSPADKDGVNQVALSAFRQYQNAYARMDFRFAREAQNVLEFSIER